MHSNKNVVESQVKSSSTAFRILSLCWIIIAAILLLLIRGEFNYQLELTEKLSAMESLVGSIPESGSLDQFGSSLSKSTTFGTAHPDCGLGHLAFSVEYPYGVLFFNEDGRVVAVSRCHNRVQPLIDLNAWGWTVFRVYGTQDNSINLYYLGCFLLYFVCWSILGILLVLAKSKIKGRA
jgi:hypothetical protein